MAEQNDNSQDKADPLAPVIEGQSFGFSAEEIDRIPQLPGVYIMRDKAGKIIYIGKAGNLKSRVNSYFTKGGDARFNVRFLMRHVETVETIITSNEKEAFLLENTLIKKEQPRYNIRLRDDKTYVSVRFNLRNEWPRAVVMRRRNESNDGALYLGPYASASAVRETLRLLQRVFPIRSCPDYVLNNRSRPCLLHQIGRCCAPCVKPVDKDEYADLVDGTIMVLKGKTSEVVARLREKMEGHSERLEYEQAAAQRDRILAIEKTVERQLVHDHHGENRDIIVMKSAGGRVAFTVFIYRNGLLTESRSFVIRDLEKDAASHMAEFLARYYEAESPPREIICDPMPDGLTLLEEWLTEQRGGKCELFLPQRGAKVRLLEMANDNCARLLEQHLSGRRSLEEINAEIMEKFHLEEAPDPIECYDISTIQGYSTVGAQVMFRKGKPDKSGYRQYKIKSFDGQDDFGALREVLTRRFKKAIETNAALPGLVLIDGGKGQLNVAQSVFEELGITGVGLVSIAKSKLKRRGEEKVRLEERFFLPGRKNAVTFASNSPSLYLLQQARDEAHRFGITFHRDWRRRRNLRSSLEDLPGVGKVRAKTLLKTFGSLKAMRELSLDEIAAAPGVPVKVAQTVYEFLNLEKDEPVEAKSAEEEIEDQAASEPSTEPHP